MVIKTSRLSSLTPWLACHQQKQKMASGQTAERQTMQIKGSVESYVFDGNAYSNFGHIVLLNKCSGWADQSIYFILFNNYCHQAPMMKGLGLIDVSSVYASWTPDKTTFFQKRERSLIFSSLKKSCFLKFVLLVNFLIQSSLNWKKIIIKIIFWQYLNRYYSMLLSSL